MRRKIIGIFICILLLFPILRIETKASTSYNPLDGGWLEERDGIKVLHLSGSLTPSMERRIIFMDSLFSVSPSVWK